MFKWDGTVAGDIDDVFTFCNSASGEDPDTVIISSNLSCDTMTVIDPNDCGGCETTGTLTNYLRTVADLQEDGDILCDVGDIALSVLNGEIDNFKTIPLKADNQAALSGDTVIGYNIEFGPLPDGLSILCLDLTP